MKTSKQKPPRDADSRAAKLHQNPNFSQILWVSNIQNETNNKRDSNNQSMKIKMLTLV